MTDQSNPFNVDKFREEIGKMFDDKLKPITDLLAKHEAVIDRHEAALQRAKGARWAFGVIWAAAWAAWEWLVHKGK